MFVIEAYRRFLFCQRSLVDLSVLWLWLLHLVVVGLGVFIVNFIVGRDLMGAAYVYLCDCELGCFLS